MSLEYSSNARLGFLDMKGQSIAAECARQWCENPLTPALSPKGARERKASHFHVRPSVSLAPLGGEGRGEGAGRPLGSNARSPHRGFTLVELLVVISIIGILFYLSLPALKDFTKGDSVGAANRQLIDDIARARRLAINNHTTVFMLFMPPEIAEFNLIPLTPYDKMQVTNLYHYQYSGYTFFSSRKAGDQPGEPVPHYFPGGWKMLPKNVFIATWKFTGGYGDIQPFKLVDVRFPTATNSASKMKFPYIAFNYRGQLVDEAEKPLSDNNGFFYIPLARGALFYAQDVNGTYLQQKVYPQETPSGNSTNQFNYIEIDQFTGRARVKQPEILR